MQSDQLPVYPPSIQGELRLILQNKDLFLLCYKYLEDYRKLSDEQNRIITKDFIEEQLKIGLDEIDELKVDEIHADRKLGLRMQHNETLLGQLTLRGMSSVGEGGTKKSLCRSPALRKCRGLSMQSNEKTRDISLFDNIAMAIEEIQRELKDKLKPLCEFYRDLFYLQLHFTLVLTQVCNYCMPLVTENIGLIDRIFFWADRPEFEMVRKSSEISDRLKDIYTRTQSVLTLLVENVMFIQNKVELQKNLERKFQEHIEIQQHEKDFILRKIHFARQDLDLMDEENDRLVGVLVKLDPEYVHTDQFNELAEFSVRRNFMEGRLTPEGFQSRKKFTETPTITKTNLKPLINNNENSSNENNILNDNLSNYEKKSCKIKSKCKSKRKNDNKDKKDNHKKNEENTQRVDTTSDLTTKFKDEHINKERIYEGKSIKEKLFNKTKGIFDSTFKKSTKKKSKENYVKVFEGEILAELSRFTPLCQSHNKTSNSWDLDNGNNSMEKSLKRKYDVKESQLLHKSNQKKKHTKA